MKLPWQKNKNTFKEKDNAYDRYSMPGYGESGEYDRYNMPEKYDEPGIYDSHNAYDNYEAYDAYNASDSYDAFEEMPIPGDKTRTLNSAHDEITGQLSAGPRSSEANPAGLGSVRSSLTNDSAAEFSQAGSSSTGEQLLLDRYEVLGSAGEGAFGSVIVAWDTRIERRVAIKCMPLEDAAGALTAQRGSILVGDRPFDTSSIVGLEEARTAAKLSDASIVSIYDFEVNEDTAYLIMEYVDGLTLAELLTQYPGEINADVVAAVFKAVSHALEVAHKRHVLHLDIKPENVLIDHQGQVKVTDFGLAKLATEAGYGTAAGGTIGYMPPEQMTQQELDERCDQWALASLTYEMIAGTNPFVVENLDEAEDAIYDAELVIPSLCMEGLDEDIDDIMFCALDPDPQERYDSVKDFAEQLQPCLGSTRKGKNALKRLVCAADADAAGDSVSVEGDAYNTEAFSDDDAYDETDENSYRGGTDELGELHPWHISERMRSVCMRVWSALNVGVLAFLGIHSVLGPESWGTQPASWGALVVCVALATVFPSWGALVVGEAFGVVLCACGAPLPGIVVMVATGVWWYFSARYSMESSNVGTAGVAFGAIGLAPFVPFVAGFLLPVRDALVSVLYAACIAVMLAGLGSGSLFSWDAMAFAPMPIDSSFNDVVLRLTSQPSTWIMILAWVLASVVSSLLCGTGKRVWCVMGMILAGAFLIAGLLAGSLLDTLGRDFLTDPSALGPIIGSCALAILLASVALPARAKRDYR